MSPPFVLQGMSENCMHPLVFPLSAAMPECTAAEAYHHTQGRALVATEHKVGYRGGGGPHVLSSSARRRGFTKGGGSCGKCRSANCLYVLQQ